MRTSKAPSQSADVSPTAVEVGGEVGGQDSECQKLFVRQDELAKLMGCSVRTIQRWTVEGKLPQPAIPNGRRLWIMKDVIEFLAERQKEMTENERRRRRQM